MCPSLKELEQSSKTRSRVYVQSDLPGCIYTSTVPGVHTLLSFRVYLSIDRQGSSPGFLFAGVAQTYAATALSIYLSGPANTEEFLSLDLPWTNFFVGLSIYLSVSICILVYLSISDVLHFLFLQIFRLPNDLIELLASVTEKDVYDYYYQQA